MDVVLAKQKNKWLNIFYHRYFSLISRFLLGDIFIFAGITRYPTLLASQSLAIDLVLLVLALQLTLQQNEFLSIDSTLG